MKYLLPILFIILTCQASALARPQFSSPISPLLKALQISLSQGNKRALRDIGTLLDKESHKGEALKLLHQYTLFKDSEIKLTSATTKAEFLNFYYEQEKEIQFSSLLKAFYITPFDQWKIPYQIAIPTEEESDASVILNSSILKIKEALKAEDFPSVKKGIKEIGVLHSKEGYQYLLQLLNQTPFANSNTVQIKNFLYPLVEVLVHYPSDETLNAFYQVFKKIDLDKIWVEEKLARLTNIHLESKDLPTLLADYQKLSNSMGSIEELKSYGYRKAFATHINFFIDPVDYYGRMLNLSDTLYWIEHNAVRDLIESGHPRAMFYIAAHLYSLKSQNRKNFSSIIKQRVKAIEKISHLKIKVQGEKARYTARIWSRKDTMVLRNYMLYWAKHYTDYEWDENRLYYINKNEAIETTQNYERLFRRLNSRNDSVAMTSFVKLSEGDPNEVIALAEKYRQMFRNYNAALPSFQYRYLEQLSQLTYFCRKNKVNYTLLPKEKKLLDALLEDLTPQERIHLENKIITLLHAGNITAIEYWACLHENKKAANFSIGRILDWYYSKSLNEIVQEPTLLRLYLKKSDVFSSIGAVGACNYYLNKFSLEDQFFQNQLQKIKETEADEGIINQLDILLHHSQEEQVESSLALFLKDPLAFSKRELRVMARPKGADYSKIIAAIQQTDKLSVINHLLFYLRLNANLEMVPYLYKLAEDERILIEKRDLSLTVADNIAPLLERIYNYTFPKIAGRKKYDIIPWLKMWKDKKRTYKNWSDFFFKEKLQRLQQKSTLAIEDINQITESPNYLPKYKKACLEALHKVKPISKIKRLEIAPRLLVSQDLEYFEPFDFSYKTLDDIPKLFEIDDAEKMFSFLERKSQHYDINDKGSFYNNLFRESWFLNYLSSGKLEDNTAKKMLYVLSNYYKENEYLTAYEEQTTQFNIAQLSFFGKSLQEQLSASTQMDTDEESRKKIQTSILARISYTEIPIAVDYLAQLHPALSFNENLFLAKDFGLPIYDIEKEAVRKEFLLDFKKLKPFQLYKKYLSAFGLDFLNKKGKLDFEKIYHILKYDIASPFVSTSGGKRDWYTYGVIKLLEYRFGTRLGFHEKLNEGQTFYKFNSSKRASAWIQYLENKKFISPAEQLPPSFNLTQNAIHR